MILKIFRMSLKQKIFLIALFVIIVLLLAKQIYFLNVCRLLCKLTSIKKLYAKCIKRNKYIYSSKINKVKAGVAYLGDLRDHSADRVCNYIMRELCKIGKYNIFFLLDTVVQLKVYFKIQIHKVKNWEDLENYIKNKNIKIVYHSYWSIYDNNLTKINVKTIGLIHMEYFGFYYGFRSIYKNLYKLRKLDVVNHQIEQDYYMYYHLGIKNLQLMPNYLTYDVNNVTCANLNNNNIILIGVDSKVKALHLGIKALSLIIKKVPDVKMFVVSPNPVRLIKLSEMLNITKSIIFIKNCHDPAPYIKKSSIMLYTSESEGFPQALSEGLSFCLPVVTNNLNFLQLTQKGAINAKLNNYTDIAEETIKLLVNHEYKYNKSMEVKNFMTQFSDFNTTKKWIKLLDALLNGEQSTKKYFNKLNSEKNLKMKEYEKKCRLRFEFIQKKFNISKSFLFEDMTNPDKIKHFN